MPYFHIQTNVDIPQQDALLKAASVEISKLLSKPESYVMVTVQSSVPMLFAGTSDPVALLTLKSIRLPTDKTKELSETLCLFMEEQLHISKERIYIDFVDLTGSMWGWNGRTF